MNIRKTSIAAIAALSVISAGAFSAPAQAGGKHFAAGLIGGIVAGAIVGSASRNAYAAPVYSAPVYRSCYTQWETQYDAYGTPHSVKVRYCN